MLPRLLWKELVPSGDAFHVARAFKTPSDPTPGHSHDFAELFWIDSGTGLHRLGQTSRTLQAGDLVFIRPGDRHGLETTGQMQLTNLAFPRETFDWLQARYFPPGGSPWGAGPQPPVRRLDRSLLAGLTRAAEELFAAPRTRLALERFLLNLCHALDRPADAGLPSDAPGWFRQACQLIRLPEHFRGGAPVFARLTGRSPAHVARVTRRLLGETPTALVNRFRLQYAARQLAMSEARIVDLALDCGLENLSYFYRLFRRHFGVSPYRYRQRCRAAW